MARGASYPIEEFLEAITAQLDHTQDALRLKAVNRPLTFALKDFNVDLKVFVEMDDQGRVAFRPAAPNEAGASSVSIGFTTITRPMIEENTISMEMTKAPPLEDLGLGDNERRQLAKIGVRNAAQLRNMQKSAGEDALSQHTGLDIGRIRSALELARPRLETVQADRPGRGVTAPTPELRPHRPAMQPHYQPHDQPQFKPRAGNGAATPAPDGGSISDRLRHSLTPGAGPVMADTPVSAPGPATAHPVERAARRLPIAPGARSIRIEGRNLVEGGRPPSAQLDGRTLGLIEAGARAVSFALPPGEGGGRLSIQMPDGATEEFDLVEDREDAR